MVPVNSGFHKRQKFSGNYPQFGDAPFKTGLLNLLAVRLTSASFGLHAGNTKFSTQNEDSMSIRRITRLILSVLSSVPHVE
jgi:hypothetical protein